MRKNMTMTIIITHALAGNDRDRLITGYILGTTHIDLHYNTGNNTGTDERRFDALILQRLIDPTTI